MLRIILFHFAIENLKLINDAILIQLFIYNELYKFTSKIP